MWTASHRTSFEAALTRAQTALFSAGVAADAADDTTAVEALTELGRQVSTLKAESMADRRRLAKVPAPMKGQTSITADS